MTPFRLGQLKTLLKIQSKDGVFNYDEYNFGLLHGLQLAVAIIEGLDPVFNELPLVFSKHQNGKRPMELINILDKGDFK